MDSLRVVPYSIDAFSDLLTTSGSSTDLIGAKSHLDYFEEYFSHPKGVGAKTIIVEKNYVDRDFLEDYAAYYVRCFHRYEHRCLRLHFFTSEFTQDDLGSFLKGNASPLTPSFLQKSYLGFLVIKPLPKTVIGRTCLRPYPDDNGRRNFPIVRSYEAHVFGLSLEVETLAFQEQDKVAAACATSALWSVFQGTGKLHHHPIPSPVEITRAASSPSALETRVLPNKGLTVNQLAQAIRSVSLEPLYLAARDEHLLKATVYAYLQGKTPLLLGLRMVDTSGRPADYDSLPAEKKPPDRCPGAHVVAVTGFSLSELPVTPLYETGFLLRASRIDKFYVHDDQIGPFSRITFGAGSLVYKTSDGTHHSADHSFSTSWKGVNQVCRNMQAVPLYVLIPLYHKVRISFSTILRVVVMFDSALEAMRLSHKLPLLTRLEWDIRLTTVTQLKAEILKAQLNAEYKYEVLTQSMPRFLWRATASCQNGVVLDLLFDATDIEQGTFFVRAVEYSEHCSIVLRTIAREEIWSDFFPSMTHRIVEWFRKQHV